MLQHRINLSMSLMPLCKENKKFCAHTKRLLSFKRFNPCGKSSNNYKLTLLLLIDPFLPVTKIPITLNFTNITAKFCTVMFLTVNIQKMFRI